MVAMPHKWQRIRMSAMGRKLPFDVTPPNREILTNTDIDRTSSKLALPDAETFNWAPHSNRHFRFGDGAADDSE